MPVGRPGESRAKRGSEGRTKEGRGKESEAREKSPANRGEWMGVKERVV